jgi:DNA-binding ferritin-like protein (Dps family)
MINGRNRLLITIVLSVLLIAQLVVFLVVQQKPNTGSAVIALLVILTAIGAIYFSFRGFKKLESRVSSLPNDYKELYINASEIVGTSNLSKYMKKDINSMLLEIFEEASSEGRDSKEVINNDLNTYVAGFVNASGGTFSFSYLLSYSTMLFVFYLFLMKAYKVLRADTATLDNISSETLDVGIVGMYALISFIFFPWMLIAIRNNASKQTSGIKRISVVFPFLIPIALVVGLIGFDSPSLRQILDTSIPLMSNVYLLFMWGVVLIISTLSTRFLRRVNLRRNL